MKKLLLILLLSFSFIGSTSANILNELFLHKLEKFNNCVDSLEKQNMDNGDKLCIDKYAGRIYKSFISKGDASARSNGQISVEIDNTSNKITIKKIHLEGTFRCMDGIMRDKSKCDDQNFDVTKYISLSPGKKQKFIFNSDETGVSLPDGVISGDWSWSIETKEFFGFKIDY
jgi:hypothetical protein